MEESKPVPPCSCPGQRIAWQQVATDLTNAKETHEKESRMDSGVYSTRQYGKKFKVFINRNERRLPGAGRGAIVAFLLPLPHRKKMALVSLGKIIVLE